tara:strand:- start:113 stop:310 length:198 start_codon:yes stop_codon:yes gene_type:complete
VKIFNQKIKKSLSNMRDTAEEANSIGDTETLYSLSIELLDLVEDTTAELENELMVARMMNYAKDG